MSDRSSPINGEYDALSAETTMRLTVRKDLFPEKRLKNSSAPISDATNLQDDLGDISCVKLETDFEQSIDEIAKQKLQVTNGLPTPEKPRHRKHKQHSRHSPSRKSSHNGYLPSHKKKKKSSSRESRSHRTQLSNCSVPSRVKGGKNLNLVSSSECQEEEESSEDELLGCSVKLPLKVVRQSGKPYSHELSQLSSKKSKSKEYSKERRSHVVMPSSGKPRSMLDICSSRSKKKSKKSESTATYRSQIVDTTTIKIKIRRTSNHERLQTPPPIIPIVAPKKSKKKKASTPVASESSGEEYDPSRGDTAASMSVAAPKPRNPPCKSRRLNNSKSKSIIAKSQKTENVKASVSKRYNDSVPQSGWAISMPEEILLKIFGYVVSSQGTLPSVIRMGKVCKLWYRVTCSPDLWKSVDLAQHTIEKFKRDYKLAWLLENRLSQCHTLNLGHWKVTNMSWVISCLTDYAPLLTELGLAGWNPLMPEQLYELMENLTHLRRLDLSLTSETGGSGTCLSAASVARLVENFGHRITHLTLANNMFTALQQILTSIASHCPNLEVLDISGARASSHPASVPLESLQKGCPKMRVFSAANAQVVLNSAGPAGPAGAWPLLEELSVAGDAAAERELLGEYRLGDEAVARLVRGATRLRLLDLRGLQRLTDSGLVRVPAWDLQHLFLGGCNVTRQNNSGLELICEKWAHSLLELDLSWASAARALDAAVDALAQHPASRLKILNLCGSSVSLGSVKKVLLKCHNLESVNLSSCRALPRGMKRLYTGKELQDLKDSFDPEKSKAKEETKSVDNKKSSKNKEEPKSESPSNKSEQSVSGVSQSKLSPSTDANTSTKTCESASNSSQMITPETETKNSPSALNKDNFELAIPKDNSPKILSPSVHSKPDSSSTPMSESSKRDMGSPYFSPVPKPDSQVQNSPEVQPEIKGNCSWSLGQFKTTPTNKSEASPLNRLDTHSKIKQCKVIEQCSPTTSQEHKLSPDNIPSVKQDIKNLNSWNYGNYSPMPRQDSQFSQHSPYSTQPSPAQPSPYSAQPSPYSTQPSPYSTQPSPYSAQPSPYSSQQSPYSAQPSPDTSQMVKPDLQKTSGQWNTGNYSPMTKHPAPFSPHPSPDPGLGVKGDAMRGNPNRTPGQYSPLSRQDRLHQSAYSPRGFSPLPRPAPAPLWTAPAPLAPQTWPFEDVRRPDEDVRDPWTLGQFRMEPPQHLHNFIEQDVDFASLSGQLGALQPPLSQNYVDESYGRPSRVD